ncbi:hypothetical protein KVP08_022945 (plasmid) [Shewanella putrefaciens]|nr:hypothetical protein KVP08_022945 [Shewanella putrefaciens]
MGAFKVVDAKPFSSEARKAVIYKYFYHLSAFRRFAANYESEKELKKVHRRLAWTGNENGWRVIV